MVFAAAIDCGKTSLNSAHSWRNPPSNFGRLLVKLRRSMESSRIDWNGREHLFRLMIFGLRAPASKRVHAWRLSINPFARFRVCDPGRIS